MEAVVAPISKYKKTNLKIYMVVCLVLAAWFSYDGYFNKDFIAKYTNDDGTIKDTLVFNQKAPIVLVVISFLVAFRIFVVKDRKVTADEEAITVNDKEKIPYTAIKKVDKTWYKEKGYVDIEYNTGEGQTSSRISSKNYDNLDAVIEKLTAKLS
jgi:hypothetical protein